MLQKSKFVFVLFSIVSMFALSLAVPVLAKTQGIFAASPKYYDGGYNGYCGNLIFTQDGTTLTVTYQMYYGWMLKETHVAAFKCDTLSPANFLIPHTKSGNPKVGNFPYSMDHNPAVVSYTYQIPLADLPGEGSMIVIAAHAVVTDGCQEETAWANCQGREYMFKSIFGRRGGSWASVVTLP